MGELDDAANGSAPDLVEARVSELEARADEKDRELGEILSELGEVSAKLTLVGNALTGNSRRIREVLDDRELVRREHDRRLKEIFDEQDRIRAQVSEVSSTLNEHHSLLASLVDAQSENGQLLAAISKGMGVSLPPKGHRAGSSGELEVRVEKRMRTKADWAKLVGSVTAAAAAVAMVVKAILDALGR